jgi:hypothetical protein
MALRARWTPCPELDSNQQPDPDRARRDDYAVARTLGHRPSVRTVGLRQVDGMSLVSTGRCCEAAERHHEP